MNIKLMRNATVIAICISRVRHSLNSVIIALVITDYDYFLYNC